MACVYFFWPSGVMMEASTSQVVREREASISLSRNLA